LVPGPAEGLLLIDKPSGVTSHDVVDACRRAYGERSIGHLGTLDPFATGLLVLLFGKATRLATFIEADPKVYEATVQFGTETDTDDGTGVPTRSGTIPPADAIRNALPSLTGEIEQVPPAYSAKHVAGHGGRAYTAARRGHPVDLPASRVVVYRWDIRALRPGVGDFTVTCGTGTYVRALARDLGRATGSAAHLTALRRTRVGPFDVRDSHTLPEVAGPDTPPPIRHLRVVADDA
jgi:tRNA pseudouridine55 synthase